jgi:hemerythrin-like domain-containing protein
MQRYNSFHLIHKALRAALYETALQLQRTDFSQPEEAEEALNKVKEVIMLFESHAHKEDTFVLPAINEYEPSVVATFEAEHVTDLQLGRNLEDAMEHVENSTTTEQKNTAGNLLNEAFVQFMTFNLHHMAKEEGSINPILWRYYSDDDIKGIGNKISASVPAWLADFFAKWMLRGSNNPEAINWIKAIKQGAPEIVVKTLIQKAEQELPEERSRKIKKALVEEPVLV